MAWPDSYEMFRPLIDGEDDRSVSDINAMMTVLENIQTQLGAGITSSSSVSDVMGGVADDLKERLDHGTRLHILQVESADLKPETSPGSDLARTTFRVYMPELNPLLKTKTGTCTSAVSGSATTLTDTALGASADEWIGSICTIGGYSQPIVDNTSTVLTAKSAWHGSEIASGTSYTLTGPLKNPRVVLYPQPGRWEKRTDYDDPHPDGNGNGWVNLLSLGHNLMGTDGSENLVGTGVGYLGWEYYTGTTVGLTPGTVGGELYADGTLPLGTPYIDIVCCAYEVTQSATCHINIFVVTDHE